MSNKRILVTGGAGYIGSHVCVELLQRKYAVTIIDNFCNSHPAVLDRIERICGTRPDFINGDIQDTQLLNRLFYDHDFYAVMHFAGLKAVSESVEVPIKYYANNVCGSLKLLHAMKCAQVRRLVFSSSATVYGSPHTLPIREDFPKTATNPYGRSKVAVEDILGDISTSEQGWNIAILRYFNPVGSHESGLIGEDPVGIPNNLFPYIAQVAVGRRDKLFVYGGDYPTPDGTGIRDYVHVVDLAEGHIAALEYIHEQGNILLTLNLGTGQGYSTLDVINAFERVTRLRIPYQIVQRRSGDIAACWADPALAKRMLRWQAKRGLDTMCANTWQWQKMNPNGYKPA